MTKKVDKVALDEVFHVAGHRGKYQIFQGLFCTIACLSSSFPALSFVFLGYTPAHSCAVLPNTTNFADYDINSSNIADIRYDKCQIEITSNESGVISLTMLPCLNGIHYEEHKDISLVSDWDLVCDRGGLAELAQTLMMLGQCFGAVFFAYLSDRFGRKPITLISYGIMVLMTISLAFVNNIATFIVLRFIVGACQQGIGLTAYSIFVEMLTPEVRLYAGIVDGLSWSLSVMSLAPFAYLLQDYSWRTFQLASLISLAHAPFLYWVLDESTRWLVANNQFEKAEANIKKICKRNKTDFNKAMKLFHREILLSQLPPTKSDSEPLIDRRKKDGESKTQLTIETNGVQRKTTTYQPVLTEVDSTISKTVIHDKDLLLNGSNEKFTDTTSNEPQKIAEPERYTVLDIFKHVDVTKLALMLCFVWTVNSLTYYGLYLTSASMSGNRFLNYFLNAMVELPAYVCIFFALKRYGRRVICAIALCICGASLITSFVFLATLGHTSGGAITSNVLSFLGKFAVSGSFMTIFIYTPEVYPTNLRNAGLGLSSAVARVGGMVAPYSGLLSEIIVWGPGVLFGGACLIAAILMYYLPETRDRPLPNTLEELRERSRERKKKPVVELIVNGNTDLSDSTLKLAF